MGELKMRVKYAKACLERKAYKDLVDLYQNGDLSPDEFQVRRAQLDEKLHQEMNRLNELF